MFEGLDHLPDTYCGSIGVRPDFTESAAILTPTILSQLALFFPSPTYYHNPYLTSGRNVKSLLPLYLSDRLSLDNTRAPSLEALANGVLLEPHPSILLVSGEDSTNGDSVIFGAYLPMEWQERPKGSEAHFGSADSLLFQLAPIHDLFRCNGSSDARYARLSREKEEGISFGNRNSGRVSLALDAALENGVFTQRADDEGPYQPCVTASGRGDAWEVRFSIADVEVWAFDPTGLLQPLKSKG